MKNFNELVQNAILNGNIKLQEKIKEIAEVADLKLKQKRAAADAILEKIPTAVEKAISEGKKSLVVMEELGTDDYRILQTKRLEACHLTGVARIIWDQCQGAKLRPTLEERFHSDCTEAGWKIVVNF